MVDLYCVQFSYSGTTLPRIPSCMQPWGELQKISKVDVKPQRYSLYAQEVGARREVLLQLMHVVTYLLAHLASMWQLKKDSLFQFS